MGQETPTGLLGPSHAIRKMGFKRERVRVPGGSV
jgi:hypothetical protein